MRNPNKLYMRKVEMLNLAEPPFYSIQGEGLSVGYPTVFVRTQGCNLAERPNKIDPSKTGCIWCDTKYAQDLSLGKEMTPEEIVAEVSKYPCKKVCITGGEPLYSYYQLDQLINLLPDYHIEVFTNNSIPIPFEYNVTSWVIDVKCPGSGVSGYNVFWNLEHIRLVDQVKFVLDSSAQDSEFALRIVKEFMLEGKCTILFSPVFGKYELKDLVEWIKLKCPTGRISPQLHKFIWEPNKRGV